jgi:hypothetical protein
MSGGADTGIARGVRIAEPYDSLSLVPTVVALMNRAEPGLPGPLIRQVLPGAQPEGCEFLMRAPRCRVSKKPQPDG